MIIGAATTVSDPSPLVGLTQAFRNPKKPSFPTFNNLPFGSSHTHFLRLSFSSSRHSSITPLNQPKTNLLKQTSILNPHQVVPPIQPNSDGNGNRRRRSCKKTDGANYLVGGKQMLLFCGFGYWVQGFGCFPWMALNFHMAHSLKLRPSLLQLVQNFGCLPMVAKPLYGVLSDSLYIGSAHRIPYISIGVFLQLLSWGSLAFIPVAGKGLTVLLICILVSSFGASITEVAKDALVAEYGQKHKVRGLQAFAFMALATGGIFGNLFGGYYLHKTQQTKSMFLLFALLLSLQNALSLLTREESLGLPPPPSNHLGRKPILEVLGEQFSVLRTAISKKRILFPLCWIVASISIVPILSGAIFCYHTQFLRLDASVIGMSKVIGQLILILATVTYECYRDKIPMSQLIGGVQIIYAASLLLDLILVKQINVRVGVSNEAYAMCLSSLGETVSQFKLLPFSVLFAKLCPPGCEGSLMSFLASALCLSYIVSNLLGVGLASLIGISYGEYSNLGWGVMLQFVAALLPLGWISCLSMYQLGEEEQKKNCSTEKLSKRHMKVKR